MFRKLILAALILFCTALTASHVSHANAAEAANSQDYENRLTPLSKPRPILGDHPEFVEPVREVGRFEAQAIVNQPDGTLEVRAWRFSYNARGIVEMPNRIRGSE